ncbi:MAG: response regulator [Candidatus Omnitrophota bacterium]|jgi:CheY-like chemotaxis protein|nr:MAG: response regulator [Candidatus Omnitrophota bacterium]
MVLSVLIVDDSKLARALLKKALSGIDTIQLEITEASDGEDALRQCRENRPDLLFLDLTMPVINGYEVLQALQNEKIDVPVFVVSADIQPKAQERVFELGAKAFIRKNIDTSQIEQILKDHQVI